MAHQSQQVQYSDGIGCLVHARAYHRLPSCCTGLVWSTCIGLAVYDCLIVHHVSAYTAGRQHALWLTECPNDSM